MKRIASAQNEEYKELQALKLRKNREKTGLFLLEGYHLIREARASGWPVRTVYVNERLAEGDSEAGEALRAFLQECAEQRVVALTEELFAALCETETPQGVLGLAERPARERQEAEPACGSRVLVLDRIQDPGNLGTILRTADAAGFDEIWLVKGTVDPFSPKVLRAAQGAVFRAQLRFTESAEETLARLHEAKRTVYATALQNAEPCYSVPLRENFALVIGNEGQGVSEAFLQGADRLVTIPMEGKAESLNAAVAAAILLFESVRQRTM